MAIHISYTLFTGYIHVILWNRDCYWLNGSRVVSVLLAPCLGCVDKVLVLSKCIVISSDLRAESLSSTRCCRIVLQYLPYSQYRSNIDPAAWILYPWFFYSVFDIHQPLSAASNRCPVLGHGLWETCWLLSCLFSLCRWVIGETMATDSPRRPSRCTGGVTVRAQAAT